MKPVDRQKACAKCDGRIPWNAKECIYCGVEIGEAPTDPASFKQHTLQESLASLYTPPYAAKSSHLFNQEEEKGEERGRSTYQESVAAFPEEETAEEVKNNFLPMFLLVIGTNLFTIGLLQLFFSTDGLLSLEWDSTYWFAYCMLAAPMVYFGYQLSAPRSHN